MKDCLVFFLTNLALVSFIGLEQFNDKVSFRLFFKKTNLSFLLISLLYTLSYPIYKAFYLMTYSYLQPLLYVVIGYSCYWLINFLRRHYDYLLVVNPTNLRFDLFYQTLIAGTLLYVFTLNLSFLTGFYAILLGYLSYTLAYILWIGLAKKIVKDIYAKLSLRYWAIYLSLLLLCLFFTCLLTCYASSD